MKSLPKGFQAVMFNCGSSVFSLTIPTAYAISTNLPNRAKDANVTSWSDPYIVKLEDSCDAIALARQVSTFSIIKAGGLKNDFSTYNLASGSVCQLLARCIECSQAKIARASSALIVALLGTDFRHRI